ncbi:hypothetical protein niasHT_017063 [Heterodera trifolii]|uniref:Sugar transporter SWEET n=1 Tax=Heterodera trifolii TaxID=157864 RepID=A0ABD2KYB5_9BILA
MFPPENDGRVFARWENLSPSVLIANYTENLAWSLFLTSTAIHAVLLIASPIQAVYKWHRRRSSDSDTPLPYICAIVGSFLWLRYSIFISDWKLILLQSYAVLMQTFFLFAMLFYRSKKRRLLRSIMAIFIGIAILFLFIAQLPPKVGLQFTGVCASGAQILGSFVCPYLIYKAISSKFIDFIPVSLSGIGFSLPLGFSPPPPLIAFYLSPFHFAPVAFTWIMELHAIIYSVGVNDIYLLTANSVFFTMDGLLLSMFFIYPSEKGPAKLEHKLINKMNTL